MHLRGRILKILEFVVHQRYLPSSVTQAQRKIDMNHLIDLQCKVLVEDLDSYCPVIIECYFLDNIVDLLVLSGETISSIYALSFCSHPTAGRSEINLLHSLPPIPIKKHLTWSFPVIPADNLADDDSEMVGDKFDIGTKRSLLHSGYFKRIEIDSMQLYTMNYKQRVFKLAGTPVALRDKDERQEHIQVFVQRTFLHFSLQGLINEYPEFLKLSTHRTYPQPSTIQHWQLRDMIACPNVRGEVFMAVNTGVKIYNINSAHQHPTESVCNEFPGKLIPDMPNDTDRFSSSISWPIRDLMFSPTCICAKYFFTQFGTSIVNAINVHSHAGMSRLIISSNDEKIRVITLPTLQEYTSFSMPMAINFSTHLLLLNVQPKSVQTKRKWWPLETRPRDIYLILLATDAAFSCSWNAASDKFAIACQDGYACVWDIRNLDKILARLPTTQHVNCVNIADARTFDALQSISINNNSNSSQEDKVITGIAFSPDTSVAYVGNINNRSNT
ncbi:hypothetical protein DI09_95p20 [Mitosporidium daphniae]|uniref:DUF2415 domain-containing protein n=1 Tax=Mitosporidium daphniae TaxID=1485682 RepID=A0A098VLQ0_9MICR|nr:uncharacterized protein DI09_95p20 [Mitosporidium daphniae]KGG49998.1 hypothetical protein DI09_95p20 [Mitosporidium daphniae]|eukprot:XP_013236434.1 uncharacterized protein DI09_95p20 [Mitosporidium daphniae]